MIKWKIQINYCTINISIYQFSDIDGLSSKIFIFYIPLNLRNSEAAASNLGDDSIQKFKGGINMKKSTMILFFSSALIVSGCGSDTTGISEESDNTSSDTGAVEQLEETIDSEETEEIEADVEEDTEVVDEDVQEDDSMKATNTYTDKELGITGEIGPMQYEIQGVQLKIIEPKDEATAELFEVAVGEEVHAFTIQMVGENTSEEDMSFYLDQATAITNTKEQLESDMILSEYIDGEYMGQVRHEGHNVYILKNSTVDELETIELRIMAPVDSEFNSVGEDASHTIEVNK